MKKNLKNPLVREESLTNIFLRMKLFVLIMLFSVTLVSAKSDPNARELQQVTVSGIVTDQQGLPVIGVTVVVKGTTIGTVTDGTGKYIISNVPQNATFVFTFMGMAPQEIPLNGQTRINVVMKEDVLSLEEVVVIGYGTQKRTSLTASVATMKVETMKSIPIANISNALSGRLTGVMSKQGSGEPGQDKTNIYIRGISSIGSSSPLVIVDGIPRSYDQIDPNNIESISILKDASAVAPYGVGGANGVILVTTKKADATPSVTYRTYFGLQRPIVLPDYVNGYEFAYLMNEAARNGGKPIPYSDEQLQKYKDGSEPDIYPPNYDVWDLLVKKNSLMQHHNVEFTGGTERLKYNFGLGFLFQDGMWKTKKLSFTEKYNLLVNIEAKVTNTTNVNLKINGSLENFRHSPSDRGGTSAGSHTSRLFELVAWSTNADIARPLFFSNGLAGSHVGAMSRGEGGYYKTQNNRIYTQISIDQEIPFIPGLKLSGLIAYDPNYVFNKQWRLPFKTYTLNNYTAPKDEWTWSGSNFNFNNPQLNEYWSKGSKLTYQAKVNYNKTLGRSHNIGVMGVIEAISTNSSYLSGEKINYNLYVDEINMGSSNKNDWTLEGTSLLQKQIGIVYRLNYDYQGKYLFESSGRYDGHYYFAPEKRFGFFPSVSLGWRLSKESFIKNNLTWVENLKIRGSYGEVGALAGDPYQYLSSYGVYSVGYPFGGTGEVRIAEGVEPNVNITWEKSKKRNIGFESSFYAFKGGVINFEADFFYEKRSNMLVSPQTKVPVEYGIGLSQVNAGVMENRGIEMSAGVNYSTSSDINISLDANFSYAKNKILQIFETPATFSNPNRRRTGQQYLAQFGYESLGLYQVDDFDSEGNLNEGHAVPQWGAVKPGDIRYKDLNDDGIIDINDETVIGYPNQVPNIIYGFSPSVRYKNWSLDILFQGAAQMHLYFRNNMAWAFYEGMSAMTNALDFWTEENTDATYPRVQSSISMNNRQSSTFWMMDANYLRLKNITLSYDFPTNLFNNVIQNLRIYASGQNVLTFTGLRDFDPEGNLDLYPPSRALSLGLNVSF